MKRLVLLGALVAMLVAAPIAQAGSRFRLLGTGWAKADGHRYAVLQLDRKPLRVIDERARRSWTIADPPAGCEAVPAGVAAGHLLWDCPAPPWGMATVSRPLLQELDTGEVGPVPGWDAYLRAFEENSPYGFIGTGPHPDGFGSHWLRGVQACYHCDAGYTYIDWHTGELAGVADGPRRVLDLDKPDLAVPLCAPLRRAAEEGEWGDPLLLDARYQRPWLLREQGPPLRAVRLYRCGRHKPLVLHRCDFSSCDADLGSGYLTWVDQTLGLARIGTFRLADRRRLAVKRIDAFGELQRTGKTFYFTTRENQVYRAPIPRR
jgi:hypothetical protein